MGTAHVSTPAAPPGAQPSASLLAKPLGRVTMVGFIMEVTSEAAFPVVRECCLPARLNGQGAFSVPSVQRQRCSP